MLRESYFVSSFVIIWGIVIWKVGREYAAESTEVPATWFGILNSLFIVGFVWFSKWWESNIILQ
jgi:POT family proton-dependent oligopeptide transporter